MARAPLCHFVPFDPRQSTLRPEYNERRALYVPFGTHPHRRRRLAFRLGQDLLFQGADPEARARICRLRDHHHRTNGTYCGLYRPQGFAKWHAETPEGFFFTPKGPRFSTNRWVLAETTASTERFFNS